MIRTINSYAPIEGEVIIPALMRLVAKPESDRLLERISESRIDMAINHADKVKEVWRDQHSAEVIRL